MSRDKFTERFNLVREALIGGPLGSLADLERVAKVSADVLRPNYASVIGDDVRLKITEGAAELLHLDPEMLAAWLLLGETLPDLEEELRTLPTLVACTGCQLLFDKDDEVNYELRLRKCRGGCVAAAERLRDPRAAQYDALLRHKLPEIRKVSDPLARAVEQTLQRREAPTYARLARLAALNPAHVAETFQALGLDKRAFNQRLAAPDKAGGPRPDRVVSQAERYSEALRRNLPRIRPAAPPPAPRKANGNGKGNGHQD